MSPPAALLTVGIALAVLLLVGIFAYHLGARDEARWWEAERERRGWR